VSNTRSHEEGRLQARPAQVPTETTAVGLRVVELGEGRVEARLYVPAGYRGEPLPLVLLLHGAGEDARDGMAQLRGQADEAGLILLAVGSRGPTWDLILSRGRFGADAATIDRALELAFSSLAVDPARVAVAGYSDGASYALALGTANGDLFSHVIASSPGFLAMGALTGSPDIFVSHGRRDGWLPIESCSRRIVPQLERGGYGVRYEEFDGGHVVPPGIAQMAAGWLASPA
jgi:phospholipase/carboxylesterase